MKIRFLSYLLIVSVSAGAQQMSETMKLEFFQIENDTCKAMDFFNQIAAAEYQTPVDQAWAGALEAAAAPCVKGAFRKLEYFSRGKKNLEEAILAEPQNPEIRFLRFATQSQAPNFLEYDNLREDKELILQLLPQLLQQKQTKTFWKEAANFMINSGKLSKSETTSVKGLIEE
jgi:hypothetical protein